MNPELSAKIDLWRQKAALGTLSRDEQKEAILLLRGDRKTAQAASATATKSRAKKEIPNADELLDMLGKA